MAASDMTCFWPHSLVLEAHQVYCELVWAVPNRKSSASISNSSKNRHEEEFKKKRERKKLKGKKERKEGKRHKEKKDDVQWRNILSLRDIHLHRVVLPCNSVLLKAILPLF